MQTNYNAGVPAATESFWDKLLATCANPLGLDEDLLEKSKEVCPHKEYEKATYRGRYLVPRSVLRYNGEEQPRDKENDPVHVNNLQNDFEVNRYNIFCQPPICCFDEENRHGTHLRGQSGFNRDEVFSRMGQEMVIVDIYDYESKMWEVVARNQSNHHTNPALSQTKNDYIKEVCNAVDAGTIEGTSDAIDVFVDLIAIDKTSKIRRHIKDTCYNNCQTYPNFRTYSASGSVKSKNTLRGFVRDYGLAPAGVEGRSDEELIQQGYILYCAGQGDNKATWMRSIAHGTRLDLPVWILGYAPTRKPDLQDFRENWVEEFNELKELCITFSETITDSDGTDINEDSFPVKFAGFLPQYVKPNPKDGGKPTENTLVDVEGETVRFDPDGDCLTLR